MQMRALLTYALVLPLSFLASRLGAIIVGAPISFCLIRASIWLRSTIVGILAGVGGVIAAVAVGWCIFSWIMGPGSFALAPFIASVFLLIIFIPKDFRESHGQSLLRAEFRAWGKRWLGAQVGNPWSTVIGDACGLILAAVWFFWIYR